MSHNPKDPWVKKAKWLTQALIISGAINIGLLCTFLYFSMSDQKQTLSPLEATPLIEKQNLQTMLHQYSPLSFQELILRLGNKDHIESGFTKRDIALACLVSFHHFNLEKALGGLTLQKRDMAYSDQKRITLYPGLADYQFEAIIHFAKTEKWPLTAEGLFLEIQATKPPYDPSLLETFYLTPEFHFAQLLFTKTGLALKKEHIAALVTSGSWETLSELTQHLRVNAEFSSVERGRFLIQLAEEKSRLAAKILLETDQDYCLKSLPDAQILQLCDLLLDRINPSFLKALLQSPRADAVWKKAATLLYLQAAETPPDTLDLAAAKRRFLELKAEAPLKATAPKTVSAAKTYTVASGDSLWKIANAHKVSVQALKAANNLKTDSLKPGQTLIIP